MTLPTDGGTTFLAEFWGILKPLGLEECLLTCREYKLSSTTDALQIAVNKGHRIPVEWELSPSSAESVVSVFLTSAEVKD